MKRIYRAAALMLALALICVFPVSAVNEYMKNEHFKSAAGSEAAQMLENRDTFVLYCYRSTCGNSRYIGAKVLMDWMDTYGKDIYGVDVDASDGVPSFVWSALGKTSGTLPFLAFVRGGEVQAFSPEGDLTAYAEQLNDAFFAFYTDVTRVCLTVVTPPKTVYQTGELFDTAGMTLQAVYADGSAETVAEGFSCTGFSSDTPGHRTVTVTYNGLTTSFTAVVNTPDGKPSVWVVQPAKSKLRYGNTATLTADFCNLPEDTRVQWTYSRRTIRGVETKTGTGTDFTLAAKGFSQTVTVTASLTDADGEPIRTPDGEAVTAQHKIRFQNHIFNRIRYWFDSLFNGGGCSSEL